MSKELPYFQFEPAEYLTKDISFCSLEAQGLFINVCSYYWQRGCELTKNQLLRRLNHESVLIELIEEGVIDLDGENLVIKFLDDQLNKATSTSKKNSMNGKKGGRPKNPIKTQNKPKINPTESQTKGTREDKIKEDEIKEDKEDYIKEVKTINNDFDIDEKTDFLKSDNTKINIIKYLKTSGTLLTESQYIRKLDQFKLKLIAEDDFYKSKNEIQKHFSNWIKFEIKQPLNKKSTPANSGNFWDQPDFKK